MTKFYLRETFDSLHDDVELRSLAGTDGDPGGLQGDREKGSLEGGVRGRVMGHNGGPHRAHGRPVKHAATVFQLFGHRSETTAQNKTSDPQADLKPRRESTECYD